MRKIIIFQTIAVLAFLANLAVLFLGYVVLFNARMALWGFIALPFTIGAAMAGFCLSKEKSKFWDFLDF